METNQEKNEIISAIKNIIDEFGMFTTFDVESESSPIIGTLGSAIMLGEEFMLNGVNGYLYLNGDENERSVDFFTYKELSIDCLQDILNLANIYQKIQGDIE